MKMLCFLLVSFFTVVESVSAQQSSVTIPDSLPIGINFPADGTTDVVIYFTKGAVNFDVSFTHTNYYRAGGTLEEVAQKLLDSLVTNSSPKAGAENDVYEIMILVQAELETVDHPLVVQQVTWQKIPFKLENTDGSWHIPKLAPVSFDDGHYNSYQAFLVPGLKAVFMDIYETGAGIKLAYGWSTNGVSDINNALYSGKADYHGPDILELWRVMVVPTLRPANDLQGTITLYFDEAKTIWASYSVDGVKVASSADPSADAPVLTIALVAQALGVQGIAPLTTSVKLTVSGHLGTVTLEYSENLKDWKVLTVLTNTTGFVDTTETATSAMRFYRIQPEG